MIRKLPLSGKRIVVTRNTEAASELAGRLRELGAEVVELPLIRITHDLDNLAAGDVFRDIAHYEWIVFTSANGVRGFFEAFFRGFEDIRSLGFMRIAAIGQGTAKAIHDLHLKVDLIPENSVAEGLADALIADQSVENLRFLVITGNRNREVLVQKLEEAGAIVDALRVYRTEPNDLAGSEEAADFRRRGADALIFASSSAVKSFGDQATHLKLEAGATVPALCSFGPITTKTMRDAGIPVAVESAEPSLDSMIEAILAHFAR